MNYIDFTYEHGKNIDLKKTNIKFWYEIANANKSLQFGKILKNNKFFSAYEATANTGSSGAIIFLINSKNNKKQYELIPFSVTFCNYIDIDYFQNIP